VGHGSPQRPLQHGLAHRKGPKIGSQDHPQDLKVEAERAYRYRFPAHQGSHGGDEDDNQDQKRSSFQLVPARIGLQDRDIEALN
jgi:hypothetical protein